MITKHKAIQETILPAEEQVHYKLGLTELVKDLEVKEKGKWKLFPAKT